MPNYFTRAFTLMKRQTTLAMYGIVFAAAMALGMVFVSGFSQPLFVASTTDAKAASQMGMFGHITLTATDPDGKITSYIQTDNLIVNVGENCVAESLFNVTTNSAAEACGGTGTHSGADSNGVADGGFTFIAIGDLIPGDNLTPENKTLSNELLKIKANSTSVKPSSGSSDPGTSAVVTLTGIFTASSGAIDIDESGIFDAAGKDAGNMLARKTFNAISLAQNDKLTVEWEITIGS